MAAGQAAKEEQVAQLKVEILALQKEHKWLGKSIHEQGTVADL